MERLRVSASESEAKEDLQQSMMAARANCLMARSISYKLALVFSRNNEAKGEIQRKAVKMNLSCSFLCERWRAEENQIFLMMGTATRTPMASKLVLPFRASQNMV